jgi:hypothetical protein
MRIATIFNKNYIDNKCEYVCSSRYLCSVSLIDKKEYMRVNIIGECINMVVSCSNVFIKELKPCLLEKKFNYSLIKEGIEDVALV